MLKGFRIAQQFVPERDLELMAENAKVVKLAANGNDVAFPFSTFVRGREPRHDAVRSNNLKDVQVFNDGGRGSQDGLFVDPSAAHLRVGGPERNKVRVKVVVHVCAGMAANRRQGYRGLGFNQASARMTELPAESVAFGMEVKGDAVQRSHRGHLSARMRPNPYSFKDEIQL